MNKSSTKNISTITNNVLEKRQLRGIVLNFKTNALENSKAKKKRTLWKPTHGKQPIPLPLYRYVYLSTFTFSADNILTSLKNVWLTGHMNQMFSTTDLRLFPRKWSLKLLSSLNLISHTSHTNLQRRTHFHKEMKSKSMCCESISRSWKWTDWILFHQVTHQIKHQQERENHFPVEFPLKASDATTATSPPSASFSHSLPQERFWKPEFGDF